MTERTELQRVIVAKLREQSNFLRDNIATWQLLGKAADEIELLTKQCEGLASAALNNGQGLLIYERALERIKDLSDSEDGEPLDDAIRIAEQALAFKAPELKLGPTRI